MISFPAATLETSATLATIIEWVKAGIIQHEKGLYQVPTRMHLEQPGLTYLLMPAIGPKYICTKLVAVVPENKQKGIPLVNGTVILHRRDTGEAVAQMDAPMITALRTAAVGAIGLKLISEANTSSIGIIGCGVQGIWQSIFAPVVRPVQQLYCYTRSPQQFDIYQQKVLARHPNLQLHWCDSAEEVVRRSPVIYTCTTSSAPVFANDANLVKDKQFISVGSFRKDMQELPDVVYQQAEQVIIDSPAAGEEVGDIINPLQKGWIADHQIIGLGKMLSQASNSTKHIPQVFKSVGMAAFDLALAENIYQAHHKP
jgi:ornithine cyclodeaminase/alanine dehydrogenase-like protein (mu-crystallin family)